MIRGLKEDSRAAGKFCILTVGVVTRLYPFAKTHPTGHLKWALLLYLSHNLKLIKKKSYRTLFVTYQMTEAKMTDHL